MSSRQPEEPLHRRWLNLPLRDFTGAGCRGLHWLFDATDAASHNEAAKICADCPVLDQCREHLRDVSIAAAGHRMGGGPAGTWAGLLIDAGGRVRKVPSWEKNPQVNRANRTPERVESGAQSGPESAVTDRGLPITQLRT